MTLSIRTEAIEVTFPNGNRALRPVDLAFEAGAFTVLLGSSGAGKSTLLRCLNGLVRPTGGRVLDADGQPIMRDLRAHRRRTGMVFQQHQLIGWLSVLDNVLVGRLGQRSRWRALLPATGRSGNRRPKRSSAAG